MAIQESFEPDVSNVAIESVDAGNATRSELFELLGALGERGHDE